VPLSRVACRTGRLIRCCASWTCRRHRDRRCGTPATQRVIPERPVSTGELRRRCELVRLRKDALAVARVVGDTQAERDGWSGRGRHARRSDAADLVARDDRCLEATAPPSPNRLRWLRRLHRGQTPDNASTTQPEPLVGYMKDTRNRTRDKCRSWRTEPIATRCPVRASSNSRRGALRASSK
jgi:hypothetical protein